MDPTLKFLHQRLADLEQEIRRTRAAIRAYKAEEMNRAPHTSPAVPIRTVDQLKAIIGALQGVTGMKMTSRDEEYIHNRLVDPGPSTEAVERLRKVGMDDLADRVTEAAAVYLDTLREIRKEVRDRVNAERYGK